MYNRIGSVAGIERSGFCQIGKRTRKTGQEAQESEKAKKEKALERERRKIQTGVKRKSRKTPSSNAKETLEELVEDFEQLIVTHDSDDGECNGCGRSFADECCWVCCDKCDKWYDADCQNLVKENIPESYICTKCR